MSQQRQRFTQVNSDMSGRGLRPHNAHLCPWRYCTLCEKLISLRGCHNERTQTHSMKGSIFKINLPAGSHHNTHWLLLWLEEKSAQLLIFTSQSRENADRCMNMIGILTQRTGTKNNGI